MFKFLFHPSIKHDDELIEWKLNAFHRLLSLLLFAVAIPVIVIFSTLDWKEMEIVAIIILLSILPAYPLLKRGLLSVSVNLFLIFSVTLHLLVMHKTGINDVAYFLFFDTLVAGLFLSSVSALCWSMFISASLIAFAMISPTFTVLPVINHNDSLTIINSTGNHLSTALFLALIGAPVSVLFQKYVRRFINVLFEANENLKKEVVVRKLSETSAQTSRLFSDSIVESAGDGIVVLDSKLMILVWNPAMEKLTGIPISDAIGKNCPSLLKGFDSAILFSLASNTLNGFETAPTDLDFSFPGHAGTCNLATTPHREADGKIDGVVFLFHDLTEQKRLELNLRQVHKMEAVGKLAGGIAHDFNNQLTGILGYTELIRRHYKNLDGDFKKWIDRISSSARRSSDLTQKLLAYARKAKHQSIIFDLHQLILETTEVLEHSMDRRIEIIRLLNAPSFHMQGDPSLLQSALLNICLNARDAMPEGGKLTFLSSVRELDEKYCESIPFSLLPGSYLTLQITDTGCGIPSDVLPKIFEPFFTTKDIGKGTGMGLPAVIGTVREHRGAVLIDSIVNKGTTVTLHFPIATPQRKLQNASTDDTIYELPNEWRVLVVDDEEALRELAYDMLVYAGCRVSTAPDGEACLNMVLKEKFDCIIMDMNMPKMNGFDSLKAVRKHFPDMPAVLMSGFSSTMPILDNNTLFLDKPYRAIVLLDSIKQLLQKKQEHAD
ncbi:MAG: response regulator [Fibrobacteres bacterium]|nr:response regulator [Fibrobacterota bacterium]